MYTQPVFKPGELSIGEVSRMLDVTTNTLRAWDKAGKLKAQRKESGYRFYLREQLIEFIRANPSYLHQRLR